MKQLIKTIIITSLAYVCLGFILGDYNAFKWTINQRFGMVLIAVSGIVIEYMRSEELDIYK